MHHSKQENKSRGFLAQLVQSIWFTPRGSGVRIPQDPQKRKRNLSKKFGFLAQLVQSIWFTPRGSGVRIPQDPQKISQISGRFFYFILTTSPLSKNLFTLFHPYQINNKILHVNFWRWQGIALL